MYYRRRPRRKSLLNYLAPFIIIGLIFVAIFFGWRVINGIFIEGSKDTYSTKVSLNIESGSAKAMTIGKQEWQNAPDKISLYNNESVKTGVDGRLTLTFFEQSMIRLNTDSEVKFTQLKQKNSTNNVKVAFEKGDIWSKVSRMTNPNSTFDIDTELITISANGASFAVSYPGTVYVMEGNVKIGVKDGKKIIKTYSVGLGQEFIITKANAESIKKNENVKVIYVLSDSFKNTNWYTWNVKKDKGEDVAISDTTTDSTSDSSSDTAVSSDTASSTAGTTDTADTSDSTDLSADKTAPTMPVITSPKVKSGETFKLTSTEQFIKGTVDSDTSAVVVNNYQLQHFKYGDKTFVYSVKTAIGNLKVGKNEYKIYAKDKAGNISKPAVVTLELSKEVAGTSTDTTETTSASIPATGGVAITAPNSGKDGKTTKTDLTISGSVPAKTAKVVVNNYTLTLFEAGDTTFNYKATTTIGNLKVGKNTYSVKAYDSADKLLGQDSIILELESSESTTSESTATSAKKSPPVIDMPSTKSSYSTTLDIIVIGGTVDKTATNVYLDGASVSGYVVGSGKWSSSIKLSEGKTTYTVEAKVSGTSIGKDSIEIEYKK